MRVLLFLTFFAFAYASWLTDLGARAMGFEVSDTCGFTRMDALNCIKQYVDVNHNGIIEYNEFERAKQTYMPMRARMALRVAKEFGYDVTLKQILRDCDANHDGIFTEQDWIDSAKTCLPGKGDLCKLKTACDMAKKN
jgi:hypothetical protein